jgi:hypothetical protein
MSAKQGQSLRRTVATVDRSAVKLAFNSYGTWILARPKVDHPPFMHLDNMRAVKVRMGRGKSILHQAGCCKSLAIGQIIADQEL